MDDRKFTLSQRESINWGEGSLLVLAGPGSGKTSVLTNRISRLLQESHNEDFKILALTFTNKAAMEMSDRIFKNTPNGRGRLFVGTFHAFCAEVLRSHGSSINVKPNFTIFSDDADLNEIVKDLQDEYYSINNDQSVYEYKILNAIKFFQENLCYSENEIMNKMPPTKKPEMFKWMYIRFHEKLMELNVLDFNSIVLLTYHLFKTNPMISKLYRLTYRYVCIDEFQDTNKAQYNLIKAFMPINKSNLFVVADDDQVIYGWNGASSKRLTEFKNEYSANLTQLSENFRCPPDVVKLANLLISHNSGRIENKYPLIAMKNDIDNNNVICVNCYENISSEVNAITNEIVSLRNINPEANIGLITRNNKTLQMYYDSLKLSGLPVVKSKRKDDFENKIIKWIHCSLKFFNRRVDEKLFADVISGLNYICQLDIDYDEILVLSRTNGDDYFSSLYKVLNDNYISNEVCLLFTKILYEKSDYRGFINSIFLWADKHIEESYNPKNEESESSLSISYVDDKNTWNNIINQIDNNYGNNINLSTFLQEFSMFSKEVEPKETDIQCMTVHASKGKEFDYVFITALVEDELPSFQSIKKGDSSTEMEEERRNCFVAITRTKKRLFLSYCKKINNWSKSPSRFLSEMKLI